MIRFESDLFHFDIATRDYDDTNMLSNVSSINLFTDGIARTPFVDVFRRSHDTFPRHVCRIKSRTCILHKKPDMPFDSLSDYIYWLSGAFIIVIFSTT